jgi:hypothetical protein
MVAPIFKDPQQQALFDKQGFIVVPFLNDEEVVTMNTIFDQLHPQLPQQGGFISGSYSNDFDYKKKASDEITAVFSKHYERLFNNYQTFGAAFLYKLPSQGSQLGIHQDWTIVDEEQYVALNCWVPLTDTDATNGALHVMPGSHYPRHNTLRAPTLPFFFTGNEEEVINQTIPFYVKAGTAVILNQSVIHYSPPNNSGKIRKAITAGIKTKNAPMVFHYKNNENKVERYTMPEDFLIRFENFATSIFESPKLGNLKDVLEYNNQVLPSDKLVPLVKKLKVNAGFAKPKVEPSFIGKLIAKLKGA